MDKYEVLKKFSHESFRGLQENAIDALLDGNRVLCLMPTGEGKSLIYQVAGLCLEKTTIVISPLIALMKQQNAFLQKKGFNSLFLSDLSYNEQLKSLTLLAKGKAPDFIFISPERAANDGYFEYVLNEKRDCIGMVVIDEVHCISQWGDGFRPAYKLIPDFLDRVFGHFAWPKILCLTATLNAEERNQVETDFCIAKTFVSSQLWRNNLELVINNLGSGKDEGKVTVLERILGDHKGEKILVFVHRKYGSKGTTRTLYEDFAEAYPASAFFNADIADKDKDRILEGFSDGSIKIVFATSAFGMGVDIPDIRVVVHYLISESVEQYYQEVGRAGRDGNKAYGYLLYTSQSRTGRNRLIDNSLCSEKAIKQEFEDRKMRKGDIFGAVKYDDFTDERRTAFALLIEYGVISILAKGLQSIKCLKARGKEGEAFLSEVSEFTSTGLTKIYCKKRNVSMNSLTADIWRLCAKGELTYCAAPSKALFYTIKDELDEKILEMIMEDQYNKRKKRKTSFAKFAKSIEDKESAEVIVKRALNIY
jgi:ATP-dependent DNA helicase RecQ